MAMRNYGVEANCMVLNANELHDLCINHRKFVNNSIEELFGLINKNEIELDILMDIVNEINYGASYFDIEASLLKLDGSNDYIYLPEDIFTFELKKDTLFECYKDFDEIYEELVQNFKQVGIIIDKNYVKEHFGRLCGSYYA